MEKVEETLRNGGKLKPIMRKLGTGRLELFALKKSKWKYYNKRVLSS